MFTEQQLFAHLFGPSTRNDLPRSLALGLSARLYTHFYRHIKAFGKEYWKHKMGIKCNLVFAIN